LEASSVEGEGVEVEDLRDCRRTQARPRGRGIEETLISAVGRGAEEGRQRRGTEVRGGGTTGRVVEYD